MVTFINPNVDIFTSTPLFHTETTFHADGDVLAHICYLYRKDTKSATIRAKIDIMHDDTASIKTFYEKCDEEHADEIRKFYRQKLVLKRLSSTEISEYDQITEWIVSNPVNHYKPSILSPLIKLPDFYREDTETRNIIKNYDSLPEDCNEHYSGVISFVGCVKRVISRGPRTIWFFKTQNNNLVRMVTSMNPEDLSYCFVKAIADNIKDIVIDTKLKRSRVPGELFWVYEVINAREMKIDFAK